MVLDLDWVPRDQNSEADAITNGDVHWLAKENEIEFNLQDLPFEVLPDLLAQGDVFYTDIEAVNAADEMNLEQGLQFERRLFHSLFATKDQKEVCRKVYTRY